jgi:hypothetical protein
VTSFDESRIVNRLLPRSWRSVLGGLRLFIGIDLRRPASWIGLAVGGWLGWWWCARTAADSGIVFASAAVLAVAAMGDVPLAMCVSAGRGLPFTWGSVWACERAAWPLVGVLLGMLAAGGEPESFGCMPAVVVGALLAAVTTVAGRLSGAKAADVASLTLLLAAASATAGSGLAPRLGESSFGAVGAWLLLGGLGWAWSRSQRAATEAVVPAPHRGGLVAGADVLHVDALPANGPLRQALTRLAMVAALAAMAGWLVFEPTLDPVSGGGLGQIGQRGQWNQMLPVHRAAVAWALFTAAWFIGLAVPHATLQDGVAGAAGWGVLFRTAAGARRGGRASRRLFPSPRLGLARFAGGVALTQAAILGWPALVCAVLSLPTPVRAGPPLAIMIGLATAAAVVTAIVLLGAATHGSRETTFAATLAIVVVLLAMVTDSMLPVRQPGQPASPSFPSLVPPL